MKVKLSYTVEEEDVLTEAGKLWTLCQDDVKQVIELFQEVPVELSKDLDGTERPNIDRCISMIDEVREALVKIDNRALEVSSIIRGYGLHRLDSSPSEEAHEAPAPEITE